MNITSNISYKELNAWGSIAISLSLLGYYFIKLSELLSESLLSSTTHSSLLLITIISFTVIQIIFQSILAASKHFEANTQDDERDNLIRLKSNSVFAFLLSASVISAVIILLMIPVNSLTWWFGLAAEQTIAAYLFVSFILCDTVNQALQLFYYRRGF